jgi:hypothetical protein
MKSAVFRIRRFTRCLAGLGLAATITASGCGTHADRLFGVRTEFLNGNLAAARTNVDKLLEKPKHDEDVLNLDKAMIELVSGRPKESERLLRVVRDDFDHYEQKDAVEIAKSMLTDDNRIAYAGEDHEKVLIRAFLALSNLMQGGVDAEAYSLQIADVQQKLIEKAGGLREHPQLEHMQVALGPYVRAMIQEETLTNADEVVRNRAMVVSFQPDFRDGKVDLARAEEAASCAPGNGVVYLFALVGAGPTKEEKLEIPTQAAMFVADRIISATAKQNVPPTLAPIRVPVVVRRINRIDHLDVKVDDQPAGATATLVDVGQLAEAHFSAKAPEIIGRAVARRALKKAVIYGVKEGVQANRSPGIDLLLNVAGVAWEATEAPDTRCWGLLPDKIQVLRVELPAGRHTLGMTPADHISRFGNPALADVEVQDGRNTYVLVNFPDSHLVGEVLTSNGPTNAPNTAAIPVAHADRQPKQPPAEPATTQVNWTATRQPIEPATFSQPE